LHEQAELRRLEREAASKCKRKSSDTGGKGKTTVLVQHQNFDFYLLLITEQHDYCVLGTCATFENSFYSHLMQLLTFAFLTPFTM